MTFFNDYFNDFGGQISKAEEGQFSEGQGEVNSERGQILEGYHVFLQTCYFCRNIVINYSYHYVYSNIFDITESLT